MNPAAPSDARARLDAVVKAYDVRGIVGEGLTEPIVEALAAGFVDEVGAAARRSSSATTCATPRRGSPRRSPRGATARGADVVADRAVLDRRELLRLGLDAAPRRRCSRRATTRPPTTASSSRRAGRAGHLARHRARRDPRSRGRLPRAAASPPRATPGVVDDGRRARRLRRVPALARRPVAASAR